MVSLNLLFISKSPLNFVSSKNVSVPPRLSTQKPNFTRETLFPQSSEASFLWATSIGLVNILEHVRSPLKNDDLQAPLGTLSSAGLSSEKEPLTVIPCGLGTTFTTKYTGKKTHWI